MIGIKAKLLVVMILRGDKHPACEYRRQGRPKIGFHPGLEYITPTTGTDGGTNKIGIFMHREKYDFARVALPVQPLCDLDAAALSHGNVQNDHIWFKFCHFRANTVPIRDGADDLIVRLEEVQHMAQDYLAIIRQ